MDEAELVAGIAAAEEIARLEARVRDLAQVMREKLPVFYFSRAQEWRKIANATPNLAQGKIAPFVEDGRVIWLWSVSGLGSSAAGKATNYAEARKAVEAADDARVVKLWGQIQRLADEGA